MNPDTNNADATTTPAEEPTPTPVVEPTPTTEVPTPESAPSVEPAPVTETPAPVAPVTPVPGVTPSPFTAETPQSPQAPQPAKPSKAKKIILIASIAAGVVILAIIALVVFLALTTVSKKDYRDAAVQLNTISEENSTLSSSVSSLGYDTGDVSDSTFNDDMQDAETSIAKIKSENVELGKLKAVRVGDGAKYYKTFNDKLTAYLAYGSDLVTSVKALRPAMVTCNKVNDAEDTAATVTALKDCSNALGNVSNLPNAEIKTYVSTLKDGYANYASTYESMAALTDPYGDQYDQYQTLRDKMYSIQDTISKASTTFSDALDKRDTDLSVKDSANALGNFLTAKQQ